MDQRDEMVAGVKLSHIAAVTGCWYSGPRRGGTRPLSSKSGLHAKGVRYFNPGSRHFAAHPGNA
jgi:hypothetical protein